MEIIVKKDILDELQRQGACAGRDEADRFLKEIVTHIGQNLADGKKVEVDGFGLILTDDANAMVTSDIIMESIASETGMATEDVNRAFSAMINFMKQRMLQGHEIQIIDFACFRIEDQKARVIKDPRSGQNMVAPAKKTLVFEPEKNLQQKVQNRPIKFIPQRDFQEQIARLKRASILLMVPTRDFFVKTVEFHFERAGWKVNTAHTVEEAEKSIASGETYLVILDTNVTNSQALCESIKCRKETSLIPLILMYPKGTDIRKADTFRICGDEQVIQPFEIKHLLTLAEAELARSSEEEAVFNQEVLFQFPTDDESIDKANELGAKLFSFSGLSDEGQVALCAAFREALGNAAQHGNKHRRDKLLEVLYLLDKEKITVAVTDSGNGFDWQRYISANTGADAIGRARESHKAGRLGGLGIMLMLKCVDRLEYNEAGNVVTLTKMLQ